MYLQSDDRLVVRVRHAGGKSNPRRPRCRKGLAGTQSAGLFFDTLLSLRLEGPSDDDESDIQKAYPAHQQVELIAGQIGWRIVEGVQDKGARGRQQSSCQQRLNDACKEIPLGRPELPSAPDSDKHCRNQSAKRLNLV